ncbi:unnamed protein product [Camellia sinensis]
MSATDNSVKTNSTISKGAFNDLYKLAMGHIKAGSSRFWAFLLATYWVSFVAYYLLWKAYNHVSDLRAAALISPEVRTEKFAILVRDIPHPPEGQLERNRLIHIFKQSIRIHFTDQWWSQTTKRSTKFGKSWKGTKRSLHTLKPYMQSQRKMVNLKGFDRQTKTGCLGLTSKKVDSIEYYNEKINELIPKLEAEQKVTLREKQQGLALVFFNSRLTAASAAQSLHAQMVDKWTVMDAPQPCQLIWTNLHKTFYERQIRQYVVYVFVALTIIFYMIPIAFISALTTLANLEKLLPFFKPVVSMVTIKTVLEAYLPQLALVIFLAILPNFHLFLSKAEGIPSVSLAGRAASGKHFYFTVFNVFIGVTIGGTLFESLKSIEKDPNSAFTLLATSLPANATFFLTYMALKFFVGYGLELSRIVPLIIYHLKRKYLCKTEAERKKAWCAILRPWLACPSKSVPQRTPSEPSDEQVRKRSGL